MGCGAEPRGSRRAVRRPPGARLARRQKRRRGGRRPRRRARRPRRRRRSRRASPPSSSRRARRRRHRSRARELPSTRRPRTARRARRALPDYRDRGASVTASRARADGVGVADDRADDRDGARRLHLSADGAGRDGKKKKLSTAKSMHVKKRDSITDASAQSREASFLKGQSDGLLAAGAVAVEEQVFHEVVEVSSRVDAELAADPTKLGAAIASRKFVPRFVVQSLELRVANPPLDGRRDSTAGSGNPSRALASLREDAGSSPTEGSMRSVARSRIRTRSAAAATAGAAATDNSYRRDEEAPRSATVAPPSNDRTRRCNGGRAVRSRSARTTTARSGNLRSRGSSAPSGSYGERRQSGTFGGDRRPSGSFRRPSGSFRRPSGSFAMRRASFGEGLGAGPSTFVQKAAAAKSFRRVGSRAPGDGRRRADEHPRHRVRGGRLRRPSPWCCSPTSRASLRSPRSSARRGRWAPRSSPS